MTVDPGDVEIAMGSTPPLVRMIEAPYASGVEEAGVVWETGESVFEGATGSVDRTLVIVCAGLLYPDDGFP